MYGIQLSLTNLRNYVLSKEVNGDLAKNFPGCKEELRTRIDSILSKWQEAKVEESSKNQHEDIKAQLTLLKKACSQETAPEKLASQVERINGCVQNHFCGCSSFSPSDIIIIEKFPAIVDAFRTGKEKMALGDYGPKGHVMIIEDEMDILDCIPRFSLVHILETADVTRLVQLKEEVLKMFQVQVDDLRYKTYDDLVEEKDALESKTIPHFTKLCEALEVLCANGVWQELEDSKKQLLCKKLLNETLSENELKDLQESDKQLLNLVQGISHIIHTHHRSEFSAIMKAASVSKEKMEKELNKAFQPLPSSSMSSFSQSLTQGFDQVTYSAMLNLYASRSNEQSASNIFSQMRPLAGFTGTPWNASTYPASLQQGVAVGVPAIDNLVGQSYSSRQSPYPPLDILRPNSRQEPNLFPSTNNGGFISLDNANEIQNRATQEQNRAIAQAVNQFVPAAQHHVPLRAFPPEFVEMSADYLRRREQEINNLLCPITPHIITDPQPVYPMGHTFDRNGQPLQTRQNVELPETILSTENEVEIEVEREVEVEIEQDIDLSTQTQTSQNTQALDMPPLESPYESDDDFMERVD